MQIKKEPVTLALFCYVVVKRLEFVDCDDQIRANRCTGFAGDALVHIDAVHWVVAI